MRGERQSSGPRDADDLRCVEKLPFFGLGYLPRNLRCDGLWMLSKQERMQVSVGEVRLPARNNRIRTIRAARATSLKSRQCPSLLKRRQEANGNAELVQPDNGIPSCTEPVEPISRRAVMPGHHTPRRIVKQQSSVTTKAKEIQEGSETTRCCCSPRLVTPSRIWFPDRRYTGGFCPRPTPGGVPVEIMSPGCKDMKRLK